MNRVFARRRPPDKAFLNTAVGRMEPTLEGPITVFDEATGLPVVAVARFPGDVTQYRWALRGWPNTTTIRQSGFRNPGGSFGYLSRNVIMRRNGCRSCGAARTDPDKHAIVCDTGAALAAQLHELLPKRAEQDSRLAKRIIRPEWMVAQEAWWTSGVVNWMSPLPYHFDQNNAPTWSAMPVVRRAVEGGHLHIPQYDLVLECRDGDVVYFAGWDLMHGVTPLRQTDKQGYRISAVYYTIEAMAQCDSPDEELRLGRIDRSRREDTLVARQRESGLLGG